jgi:hypothetical protein
MTQHEFDRRSRVWLPATAAVVALVVSATVAFTHHTDRSNQSSYADFSPSRMNVNSSEITNEVDRCWAAAQKLRKTVQYPDRSEWQPALAARGPRSTVIGIRTKNRPFFCETTQNSATLSDPAADPVYALGTKTGAVFGTDAGALAGVVDPSWSQVQVGATYFGQQYSGTAVVQDGLFIYIGYISTTNSAMAVRRTDGDPQILLPKTRPGFGTVDADLQRGDHSTSRGAQLYQCVDDVGPLGTVPDTDSWNPGARVQANSGQKPVFLPYVTTKAWATEPTVLNVVPSVGGRSVLTGVLPPGVSRMRLTFADNTTSDADVSSNTFASLLPPTGTPTSCTLFGTSGQILYIGPIATS